MERNGMECELGSDLRNKLNGDRILTEFNDRRRFVWKKDREWAKWETLFQTKPSTKANQSIGKKISSLSNCIHFVIIVSPTNSFSHINSN